MVGVLVVGRNEKDGKMCVHVCVFIFLLLVCVDACICVPLAALPVRQQVPIGVVRPVFVFMFVDSLVGLGLGLVFDRPPMVRPTHNTNTTRQWRIDRTIEPVKHQRPQPAPSLKQNQAPPTNRRTGRGYGAPGGWPGRRGPWPAGRWRSGRALRRRRPAR